MKAAAVVLTVLAAFLAGRYLNVEATEHDWRLWREWLNVWAWPVAIVGSGLAIANAVIKRRGVR